MTTFTRRQLLIFVSLCLQNVCHALCYALQAPFYPSVAESKGVNPTEYGLVFGVYQLTIFIVCPIFGRFISKIGPKRLLVTCTFLTGSSCILFGQLIKVDNTKSFLILSFLIRISEAIGSAGSATASFSIIAKEFPESVGSTMAVLEMLVGVGLIVSPTIGGVLYGIGGFMLPFNVFGLILIVCSVSTLIFLPSTDCPENTEIEVSSITLLKIPEIQISMFSNFVAANNIGYLQATLEPHIRFLNLPPYLLGLMFIISGGSFGISAPIWGKLCDKGFHSIFLHILAALFVSSGWLLIGPAPFLPFEPSLHLIIIGLVLNGIGMGGELIPSFSGSHKFVVSAGLPRNLATFGLVSGIWNSIYALGGFIGPTVGGALLDSTGFRNATIYVLALHGLLALVSAFYIWYMKKCHTCSDEFSLLNHTDESVLSRNVGLSDSSEHSRLLPVNSKSYYASIN